MILENGVIRTMDPSLPTARALAIAGDVIAGGVGAHEAALPSPDVVDLGGRCVVPGFTDSHVHFPTWSLARLDVRLEGVSSLAEALARVREHPRRGSWIRGTGWRSAEWETQPTKEALDEVTGGVPAALWARDYHSLWLNSAALAIAGGDLDVEGGVVERDESGEPTGILREESAWQFRARFASVPEDEWVDAAREGMRVAAMRGVTAVHDKDGWLGAPGIFQRLAEREGLTLRVWQSVPHESLPALAELGLRSGIGDEFLRIGYLKAFMDGTLGSQTAWMLDGAGVVITSGGELAEIIRAGARAGWPVSGHATSGRPSGSVTGSSTRSAWRPRTSDALPSSESRAPSSSATRRRTATSPTASGETGSRAPMRFARSGNRERSSRTARMLPWRSSTHSPASARGCCARSTSGRRGAPTSA
jgi:predicted amidohydrolase YtcJ